MKIIEYYFWFQLIALVIFIIWATYNLRNEKVFKHSLRRLYFKYHFEKWYSGVSIIPSLKFYYCGSFDRGFLYQIIFSLWFISISIRYTDQ